MLGILNNSINASGMKLFHLFGIGADSIMAITHCIERTDIFVSMQPVWLM